MNYLMALLLFVPVALLSRYLVGPPLLTFIAAALAIVPLSSLMGRGTEELASRAGPRVGGLINGTLGNAAELIIAIVAIRAGKIELVISDEEGQEDVLMGRLMGEAVKNVFAERVELKRCRPIIQRFDQGDSFQTGELISSEQYVERLVEFPELRSLASQTAEKLEPKLFGSEAHDALLASVVEFILEGLHVHNKLNKHEKAGRARYKR